MRHLPSKTSARRRAPAAVAAAFALLSTSVITQSAPAGAYGAPDEVDAVRFVDATRGAGVAYPRTPTYGAVALDAERDGAIELILNRHKRRARFYTWTGDRFEERYGTGIQKVPPGRRYYDRHSCAWGEANGDGRLDLYCSSGAKGGQGTGANRLLVARGDGWRNEAWERHVADRFGRGRSVNWIDYDGDLDLDLFVANEMRDGHPSVMFRNDGDRFVRDRDAGVAARISPAAAVWSDWDADGDPDLLIASRRTTGTVALENRAGRFGAIEVPGVTGLPWASAAVADFDGDGLSDLHLLSPDLSRIMRNTGDGFTVVDDRPVANGRASVWLDVDNDRDLDAAVVQGAPQEDGFRIGRDRPDFLLVNVAGSFRRAGRSLLPAVGGGGDALTAADYDRDGRVDLYITNGYQETRGRPVLLRNTTDAGRSIALRLFGDDANPLGFGARVTVTADGVARRAEVTDGAVTRAQVDVERLHFGIGTAPYARVTIEWPDGTRDCAPVVAGGEGRIEKGLFPCALSPPAAGAPGGG